MVNELMDFAYHVFGVPYAWMQFPDIIFYFFIPLGLLVAIYYIFLEKGVRAMSSGPNAAIAIIIALLSSRVAVFTSSAFGMIGGVAVLSLVLIGLSALFYRFAFEIAMIGIWGILLVFACVFKYVDWPLFTAVFGFFAVVGFFSWVLKVIKLRSFLILVVLLIAAVILPPLVLQQVCPGIQLFI